MDRLRITQRDRHRETAVYCRQWLKHGQRQKQRKKEREMQTFVREAKAFRARKAHRRAQKHTKAHRGRQAESQRHSQLETDGDRLNDRQ